MANATGARRGDVVTWRMPRLFSYGTLQNDDVQLQTFGRLLRGDADVLQRFALAFVKIESDARAAAVGRTHNAHVTFTGRHEQRVPGMVFEVSEAELSAADAYEALDGYVRVSVALASGCEAWIYVDARDRPPL